MSRNSAAPVQDRERNNLVVLLRDETDHAAIHP